MKLPVDVKVVADHAIKSIRNGIAGANEDGFHLVNVNPERDFAVNDYLDIRFIQEEILLLMDKVTLSLQKVSRLVIFSN